MKRRAFYILRQTLIGIIALQFLNLSVGSQAYWDNDYDYSYAYNTSYDPTETAVEWIVEMNCGQQPAFSYNNHSDTNKNLAKTFHWQTDLPACHLVRIESPLSPTYGSEPPVRRILSPSADILSPPPETA